jgi:hypothetical protein
MGTAPTTIMFLKHRKKQPKSRLPLLFFVVFLLLLLPVAISISRRASKASAAWFDEGWSYRQRIDISNSSGSTQSNFQVQLSFNTSALITAGKLQTNCNDLRITDQGGNLLPFWIEPTTCNTTTTKIWVKVTSIPTSGAPLYLYYSNPSASSGSSTASGVFIREMSSAAISWPLDDTTVTQSYARVINPAITPTRNIVINGTFDTDTTWTKGTGWTIAGGVAHNDGTGNGANLNQSIPTTGGKAYQVTFTVSNFSSGSVRFVLSGSVTGTSRTANGTYTESVIASTGSTTFAIQTGATFIGDIDNVIVTEVNIPSSGSTPTQIMPDGNMETAGTGSWSQGGNATLTKQSTNPHGGTQVLRVARNGISPAGAQQNSLLTAGNIYRVYGYARSDGNATPTVACSGATQFTGTTSTGWQPFDFVVVSTVAGGNTCALRATAGVDGQYTEFDDITVTLDTSIRTGEIISDGDMEAADIGYWVDTNGSTTTKQTTSPHGGSQVLRVTSGGNSNAEATQSPLATGKRYRITGYMRSDGNASPRIAVSTGNIVTGTTSTSWQAFDITFIAPYKDLYFAAGSGTNGQYSEYDDVSLTELDPLVGIPGNGVTLGSASGGHLTNAYTFDGTNDNVNIYTSDLNSTLNPDEGTLVTWAKVTNAGVWTDATNRWLVRLFTDNNNRIDLYKTSTSNIMNLETSFGGVGKTISISNSSTGWIEIVATWSKSANQLKLYINGSQVGSTLTGLGTWTGNFSSTNVSIGSSGAGSTPWSGLINDVRLYTRALSSDEIADMYSASSDRQAYYTENYPGKELVRNYNTGVTVAAPATEEVGGGPAFYWKLDEGGGQTVKSSANQTTGSSGTLGADSSVASDDPTWLPEDQCVSGKCLQFDGSNDYVNFSPMYSLGNYPNYTLSVWFRTTDTSSTIIYSQGNSGSNNPLADIRVNNGGAGTIYAEYRDDAAVTYASANYSVNANDGKWHMATLVKTGTNFDLYFDTRYLETRGAALTTTTFNKACIGALCRVSNTNFFKGEIDSVKIYPYTRTAAQIKADFNSKGTKEGAAVAMGAADNSALNSGLVGYWKMDEATWTNDCSTGSILDSSGNGANGKSCANGTGPTTPGTGKFGNAGAFDGTNDQVNFGDPASGIFDFGTGDFTLAIWEKMTSGTTSKGYPISKFTSGGVHYFIFANNPYMNMEVSDGTNTNNFNFSDPTAYDSNWHHIVMVYKNKTIYYYRDGVLKTSATNNSVDNLNNGNALALGCRGGFASSADCFDGLLDEARVYNRALTPQEVTALYNFAPGPVAYWKFDEQNGTSVADSSGNNYTGTWSGTGTHWTQGKFGSGGKFNGTNDVVDMGSTVNSKLITQGTISFWMNPSSVGGSRHAVIGSDYWVDNCFNMDIYETGGVIRYVWGANKYVTTTYVPVVNQWQYITLVYDGTLASNNFYFYVNGRLHTNSGNYTGNLSSSCGSNFNIGNTHTAFSFAGQLDDVKIYNYARSQAQILQDMGGKDAPYGASPLGYWKFDDGFGTTTKNSGTGGTALNGTLTGMASAATYKSGWQQTGKIGKALAFDGSNDYVTIANSSALDTTDVTVTAWIKTSTSQTDAYIINKWVSPHAYPFALRDTNNKARFTVYDGTHNPIVTGTTNLNDGNWHHLVGIRSSSLGKLLVYVDGKQEANVSDTTTAALTNTDPINIGVYDASNNQFTGYIDEVKIYPFALTDDQIKTDYNSGVSLGLGRGDESTAAPGASDRSALTDGLVGWWKMDEATWSGTLNEVVDSSGNANHGTAAGAVNGMAYPLAGKFGSGGLFDGVDDYVTVPDNSNLSPSNITVSAWVKANSTLDSGTIYGLVTKFSAAGWMLEFYNNRIYWVLNTGSGFLYEPFNVPSVGTWNHIAVTQTGTTVSIYANGALLGSGNANAGISNVVTPLLFGKRSDGYLSPVTLDDVRVYNRALSPAEVAQLAAWAPGPVGYWKLDEQNASTINDSSGFGNTGGWNGSGTHWTQGKFGSAAKFNGSDDYISVPSQPIGEATTWTVSAWIKWLSGAGNIYSETVSGNNNPFIGLTVLANRKLEIVDRDNTPTGWVNAGTTATITSGQWTYVTVVRTSATTGKVYINGQESTADAATFSQPATLSTNQTSIGARRRVSNDSFFNGVIDEVKVYNYARTPAQIAYDYNRGAPIGYWKLDECQGSTLHDSSGNGLDGTWNGVSGGSQTSAGTCTTSSTAWGNGATGKFGASLNFDGTDDYVQIADNAIFTPQGTSSSLSVSAWVKTTSIGSIQGIVSKDRYGGGSDRSWSLSLTATGGLQWFVTQQADGAVRMLINPTTKALTPNTWYHIVGVYDGLTDMGTVYINGVADPTTSTQALTTIFDNSEPLHIGTLDNGGTLSLFFNGQIDDVRIFNYALSPFQVLNLYNGGAAVRFGP